MDFPSLLNVLRRRFWTILYVAVGVSAILAFRLAREPAYEGVVNIQIEVPPQDAVVLFDPSSVYRDYRDEITVVRNNFTQLLRSAEVRNRVARTLGLAPTEAKYDVRVTPLRDSDFVDVAVSAGTPDLAAQIANTHVAEAVAYYGELRRRPASEAKNFIDAQLKLAADKLQAAEQAAQGPSPTVVQKENLRQATEEYQLLQKKQSEATLKENQARGTSFVQIIEPATPPTQAAFSKLLPLMAMGVAGSLGLGMILALVLDALTPRLRWRLPVPARRRSIPIPTPAAQPGPSL